MKLGLFLASLMVLLAYGVLASAQAAERALLIVDADSGAVLHAQQANRLHAPASLAKLMTVHLVLDQVATGKMNLSQMVLVSEQAANQPPRAIGLQPGESVSLQALLLAVVVASGNDAAVALAEAHSGDETSFVTAMNTRAAQLGMTRTRFGNASGLPATGQMTTARDMAVLARSLLERHPDQFRLFSTRRLELNGRHLNTHNRFLTRYRGSLGLKTGFTCRAGYNLVAAAVRDNRSLIGVLLGSATSSKRYTAMASAMDAAFTSAPTSTGLDMDNLTVSEGQGQNEPLNNTFIAEACLHPRRAGNLHAVHGWSLEFGLEVEQEAAVSLARRFISRHADTLRGGQPLLIPRWARDIIYRVAVTGLQHDAALQMCRQLRTDNTYCVLLPPETAQLSVDRALQTLEWHAANSTVDEKPLSE